MKDGIYDKYVYETQSLKIDYTDGLATSETVDSATSVITNSSGSDVSSTMITSTTISSPYVYVVITGGEAGEQYILDVTATTNSGNVKIFRILVAVSE